MGRSVVSLASSVGNSAAAAPAEAGVSDGAEDNAEAVSVLERIAQRVQPIVRADEQLHPVDERLHAVLPWSGLRRGSLIESSSRALGWLLVAEAARAGAWVAAVGINSPGWAAAAEIGVPLERLAVITSPPAEVAATVLGALVDAVEIVLVDPSVNIRPHELRRIAARVRERKGLLVACGEVGSAWEGVDVRLRVTGTTWHGLEQGHGALCGSKVDIEATGRGAAFRPRRTSLWLQGGPTRWADAESGAESGGQSQAVSARELAHGHGYEAGAVADVRHAASA
jgi:hypothetical protein